MTFSLATHGVRAVLMAGIVFAALPSFAQDQGTDEQREACTPDAVRLCQDTIPDIPRTTACMQAHYRQLSPRCKAVFSASASPKTSAPGAAEPAAPSTRAAAPAPAPVPGSVAAYRADIARDCAQGLIDSFTCKSTLEALKSIE